MGREAQPRYWQTRGMWYALIRGKRYPLVRKGAGQPPCRESEAEAWVQFKRLLEQLREEGAIRAEPGASISVRTMGLRYLDSLVPGGKSERTRITYQTTVRAFSEKFGDRAADGIRPADVRDFLARDDWGPTTKAHHIGIIKSWYAWAKEQDLVPGDCDPTAKIKPPARKVLERVPGPEEVERLLEVEKPGWLCDLCAVIHGTGCRPDEAYRLEARHVNLAEGYWQISGKTTNATGQDRMIQFGGKAREVIERCMRERPTGPLLVGPTGARNNATTASKYLRIARRKAGLGDHVTLKSLRHLFATDALAKGYSVATVAALLGHQNWKQIQSTYGRLATRRKELAEALEKIRGDQ
jgi:integrase